MFFQRRNLPKVILLIVIALILIFVGIMMKNLGTYPDNRFDIKEDDNFNLSHFYNINGVVGYEKTEFTSNEKRLIMEFISSLDNEENVPTNEEFKYGMPPNLTISNQDYTTVFYLNNVTNIEVKKSDQHGNLLYDKRYTSTVKQMKNMYKMLGLPSNEIQKD